MNDLIAKLNQTVSLEDFQALEDRLDQYQLYKDCMKIRNDHDILFENINKTLLVKADQEHLREQLNLLKNDLVSKIGER